MAPPVWGGAIKRPYTHSLSMKVAHKVFPSRPIKLPHSGGGEEKMTDSFLTRCHMRAPARTIIRSSSIPPPLRPPLLSRRACACGPAPGSSPSTHPPSSAWSSPASAPSRRAGTHALCASTNHAYSQWLKPRHAAVHDGIFMHTAVHLHRLHAGRRRGAVAGGTRSSADAGLDIVLLVQGPRAWVLRSTH